MAILAFIISLIFSMGLAGQAFAQSLKSSQPTPEPTAQCTELYKAFGDWRFHRQPITNPDDCFLSALSVNVPGLLYRSYLFTMGELMVFNSFDANDSSAGTGARVYFFFPRNQTPDIEDVGDVVYMKSSFKGVNLGIDYKKGVVTGFTGITAKIDPKITPENNGGVEVLSSPTLWLDLGFAQGHDPSTEPARIAVFHDVNGKTCAVKNSELFDYYNDGDDSFKYSDADLKVFLAKRCPSLTVNY
jgi:hypothetical protein